MDIHDDILDTTELINEELKKYAKQMKEKTFSEEYIISYDRIQSSAELEGLCERMIRKRQFPAIYDFFTEENKFIIYENVNSDSPDALIKTEG